MPTNRLTPEALDAPRIIVGFSGGITSARCAQWALDNFPREQVTLLFHDTKEEDPDTYWFMREVADKLGVPIVEQSDGRSASQVFDDGISLRELRNTPLKRAVSWREKFEVPCECIG